MSVVGTEVPIQTSMARYVAERAALKYTFFGGKGGVGKTAMAGATALWLARQGKRTLLASTNPVHSLSGLLGQNVAERHTPVAGVDRLWVDKMLKSREEARSLREMLSFTKKKEADPLLEYLLGFRSRMAQARRLLTDATRTAFFFVTLPEALPIAVITRFIGWFHEFGIPVGGVIVNMVLDRRALGTDAPEFVRNRMRMQDDHLKTIREKFDGSVRAVVPLFDQEVRGTAMLEKAAGALFA